MRNYYTERTYSNRSNNYYTPRINSNSLFRNFLVDENVDDLKKFFVNKRKEVLPRYTNIKEKIEKGKKDIKSKFDIESTLFKEIQLADTLGYSNFANNASQYFFGPNGIITKENLNLKTFYKQREKQKKLSNKIYAGTWFYLDENPKYIRYLARLKHNRKKLLDMGGNFSTENDFTQKLHDIYLRGSRKKKLKQNKKVNTPEKNIFEYTAIKKPYNIKKVYNQRKYINKNNINALLLKTTRNFSENKSRNTNNNISEQKRSKTMYNDNHISKGIKKIKTIYLRERLLEKQKKEKKKYFSNLKLTLDKKLNILKIPIKNMKKDIFLIKKKNKTIHTFREVKDKYKEDIKVIGEDDQKEADDFMNNFIKKAYRIQTQSRKNFNPKKIFFTYFENKGNTVRESLKKFMRSIEKYKDEERKIKYGKCIRETFQSNLRTIENLSKELDELKIKNKRLFDN